MKRNLEIIAIIIALAALLVGVLSWLSPFNPVGNSPLTTNDTPNEPFTPQIQQSPTSIPNTVVATSAPETPKPIPTIASSPFTTLVFSDDFENGNNNFSLGDGSGSINVVDEGNGNNVLELSDAGIYTLLVNFGSENISDCSVEYRVKIISLDNKSETSGVANLLLRHAGLGKPTYVFSFDAHYQITQFYYFPPFELLQGVPFGIPTNIENEKWYDIRVEMDGENLRAYIDGVSVLQGTDSRLRSGKLGFQVYPNTIIDFDDVKIWSR